jgi:mRNA interferase RelE/StbE
MGLPSCDPRGPQGITALTPATAPATADPRLIGEALKGDVLRRYWKYRVGDYRLICSLENDLPFRGRPWRDARVRNFP